jgi:DNA polymerase I-like protein with 3'-5' exonuclease and polymerase domains
MAETEPLLRNYQASIPGIMGVSSKVTQLVAERGYVRYWDGRRRHIKNRRESYKAWNSVCQGGAAQLVKQAMLRIEKLEDENFFMVLQVHDEITFAIRRDMISHYEPAIVEAMTDFPIFNVHLAVEGKEWK